MNRKKYSLATSCAYGHRSGPRESGVVVYTCVTDNYDDITQLEEVGSREDCVCFSDRPAKAPATWEKRPLQSPRRLRSGHDISRFHKVFPHRIFPDARYSVYIDGNVSFHQSYGTLVD